MFNGIFGHKPTGGLISTTGHFPHSVDEKFSQFLVLGPMCRYAKDLPILLHIMAGSNSPKLRLHETIYTKDINVRIKSSNFIRHNYFFRVDFLYGRRWIFIVRYSSTGRNENIYAKGC